MAFTPDSVANMLRWWIVVVVVVVFVVKRTGMSGVNARRTGNFCLNLRPIKGLDLNKLMGLWYAVEIIQHHHAPRKNLSVTTTESCPVLILTRMAENRVRLLWDEERNMREFSFVVPIMHSPEFWIEATDLRGSVSDYRSHDLQSLSGNYQSAQVMKAVGSHMVLTLCSRQEHQVMSVLMAREMKLDKIEVISVNNMLDRRGLAMSQIRETCKNGATKLGRATSWLMVVLVLLGIMVTKLGRATSWLMVVLVLLGEMVTKKNFIDKTSKA